MAVDEAILESVGARMQPPTLRLYRWTPACLSLGYAQRADEVDRARLDSHGWHLVRRMTGGRAILHTDELTYSVTFPDSHPLVAGTILDSYRRLSTALMAALHDLGIDVHADKRSERATALGPVCFEVPSDYEITANGKKLIGSAQVRRHAGALQHGSLPLVGDLGRICETLVFPDETARQTQRERVLVRAATVYDVSGLNIPWEQAALAVANAFAETFSITLEDGCLSEAEADRAAALRDTRYGDDSWTLKI